TIGIDRHAAPSQNSQPLDFRGCMDCSPACRARLRREKCHAQPERRREVDSLLLRAGREELRRHRKEQPGAVATRSVRVHATPVCKPAQSRQGSPNDLMARGTAQTGHKARTARIVVRMAPIGMLTHTGFYMATGSELYNAEFLCRGIDF